MRGRKAPDALVEGFVAARHFDREELRGWVLGSWEFAKQILPLLLGGVLVAGAAPEEPAFRLLFPVDTPGQAPLLVPAAATARGHETVLVVDDEPGLRALARTGLQQHGFDVLAVETGEQALEILGRGEPRVDAMLLDLTLPGIPGEAVLREVHRTAPHLPVVIASGYATMESQAAWLEAGAVGFVAKPFHIQQVAQRLREALDRRLPPVPPPAARS